ncbi:MAG: PEP-utilizing enzyme [Candidatus Woesearchaeota archaeon]
MSKEKWVLVVSFKVELLSEFSIIKGQRDFGKKVLPIFPSYRNYLYIDNDIYNDAVEFKRIKEYLLANPVLRVEHVYNVIQEQSSKFLSVATRCNKGVTTTTPTDQLAERMRVFLQEFQKTASLMGVPTLIDIILSEVLSAYLEKDLKEQARFALARLAVPYKRLGLFKEKIELAHIALSAAAHGLNSPKVQLLTTKHARNYGWIHSTFFLGCRYGKHEIEKELRQMIPNAKREITMLLQGRAKQLSEARLTRSKITSVEGRQIAGLLTKAVYFRTARLESLNKACYEVRPLFKEVARRLDLSFNELIHLLPDEILRSLSDGSVSRKARMAIRMRQKAYGIISDAKHEAVVITGPKIGEWKKRLAVASKSTDIVKGIPAFTGIVRGKVVVVKDRTELFKVKKGNIVVIPLTTPDYIIAMKKAAGVVTDLGGVTSHAAITSRELKIPCIVGTSNATKVLKDGDYVEVDANKGIVKILKRSK